ncbi:MAG TPA: stage III sporulation protein AF [Clostridiaceae bacterium]
MEVFKTYIVSITSAIIFIIIVEMILPDNNQKKYAKFVLGLILVLILIRPIINLYAAGFNINKMESTINKYIPISDGNTVNADDSTEKTLSLFQSNLENSLKQSLIIKYPSGDFDVGAVVKYDKTSKIVSIEGITVSYFDKNSKKAVIIDKEKEADDSISRDIKELIYSNYSIAQSIIKVYRTG